MTDSAEFVKMAGKKSVDADLDLENIDDLLAQLTAAEIDELNGDFDPDVRNSLCCFCEMGHFITLLVNFFIE